MELVKQENNSVLELPSLIVPYHRRVAVKGHSIVILACIQLYEIFFFCIFFTYYYNSITPATIKMTSPITMMISKSTYEQNI